MELTKKNCCKQSLPEINANNFSALSESLYVAEQQARKAVRLRTVTQRKLAVAANAEKEAELRELAKQRRMERGGMVAATGTGEHDDKPPGHLKDDEQNDTDLESDAESDGGGDDEAALQRERLRIEWKREREKELRMKRNMDAIKKQRLEEERDVSEKIALGMATGSGGGDAVDSRLYNTSAGMDSGFGRDDEYTAYTKPLLDRSQAASIYRPTRRGEVDADEQYDALKAGASTKFQPHKGFDGAEGGGAGPRTAPVQFEKSKK